MDIHNKEFATKLRGYDSKQVDSFLDRIVDAYGDALDQIVDLKNENVELKKRVDKYDKVKDSINESLISAQENAEEIKRRQISKLKKLSKKLIKTQMIFLKRLKMTAIKRELNFRANMIL